MHFGVIDASAARPAAHLNHCLPESTHPPFCLRLEGKVRAAPAGIPSDLGGTFLSHLGWVNLQGRRQEIAPSSLTSSVLPLRHINADRVCVLLR